TIEVRDPAQIEATQKSVWRAELESSLQYPGPLSEGRRQEIQQARTLFETVMPLLHDPVRNANAIQGVLNKIAQHVQQQPPTPYREAIFQVKRRIEAARRGEAVLPPVVRTSLTKAGQPGQTAADFVVPDYTRKGSARLSDWKGKTIVLVFYQPGSPTTGPLLRFAQQLSQRVPDQLAVVGLAVGGEAT